MRHGSDERKTDGDRATGDAGIPRHAGQASRLSRVLHRGTSSPRSRGPTSGAKDERPPEQLIRYVHEIAFDARPELKNLLVDDGKAAIEADFAGTHIAEFAGIQPAGREVRVPYSVVYDLRGDKISALRIYFPMGLLIEQLTS